MTKAKASEQTATSASNTMMSSMRLDEFERRLATGADHERFKSDVMGSIDGVQQEILPLRLKFNEFLAVMSSLDSNDMKMTNQEKYKFVRDKLLSLYNDIQKLSGNFQPLEPLLNCVGEYTKLNNSKEFEPLETLSINYNSAGSTMNSTPTVKHTKKNSATPTSTAATVVTNGTTSSIAPNANNKASPQTNTPGTFSANTPTPNTPAAANATIGSTATTTATKKPRKHRAPRKTSGTASQSSTPVSANISMNTATTNVPNNNSAVKVQSPLTQTIPMGQGTMNPSNIISNGNVITQASANNHSNNGSTILSPANVLNSAILNTGNGMGMNMGMNTPNAGNTSINTTATSTNNLTPANILNMNMNGMGAGDNGNTNKASNNTSNNVNNNNADLSAMDLSSLDLSGLNMDFL